MKEDWARSLRRFLVVVFILYLILLVYLLFFFDVRTSMPDTGQLHYNIVPFQEIQRFYENADLLGAAAFANLYGNVLIFMPFGFLLPAIWRRMRGFFKVFGLSLLVTFGVEATQLLTMHGCFDVDDMILNMIGGMLGFVIFWICYGILCLFLRARRRNKKWK